MDLQEFARILACSVEEGFLPFSANQGPDFIHFVNILAPCVFTGIFSGEDFIEQDFSVWLDSDLFCCIFEFVYDSQISYDILAMDSNSE
jgi:hypothetical protein